MFEASMRPDTCNIRTIKVPAPNPLVPKRTEAQGFVSKKPARGKADCEMVAEGTTI